MKTSDKLLTGFFGLSLLILCAVQGSLYAKYKKGEIIQSKMLLEEAFTKYNLPFSSSSHIISVKGFQHVHIIPSDSMYFMLEKNVSGKAVYTLIQDTLFIDGNPTESLNNGSQTKPPMPTAGLNQDAKVVKMEIRLLPELNQQGLIIYYTNNDRIRLEDGDAFLHGSMAPYKFNAAIDITNGHLELGNDYSEGDEYLNKFYNDIVIHLNNSGLTMNSKSVVKSLQISMDDRSILTDNGSVVDSIALNCSGQSRLELSGKNAKNLRFVN
jgi:hypothetical protein